MDAKHSALSEKLAEWRGLRPGSRAVLAVDRKQREIGEKIVIGIRLDSCTISESSWGISAGLTVTLVLAGGVIVDISGGAVAGELKQQLFALPEDCRRLVELGQGLSNMEPTWLIGVDESILSSCHFGFWDGGGCGVHLDMVISSPAICRQ